MSNLVYPVLPGRGLPSSRSVLPPKVHIRTTPSQREFRSRDSLLPRYQYSVPYEWLKSRADSPQLQTLVGFYLSVGGPFDSWLYLDPDDSSVTAQQIGLGNGTTTTWQLVRSFGGFAEPVYDPLAGGSVTAGVASGTIGSAGLVTFASAPSAGVPVLWTGQYYRRCRFLGDRLDTEKFMAKLFSAKRVEFISTKA